MGKSVAPKLKRFWKKSSKPNISKGRGSYVYGSHRVSNEKAAVVAARAAKNDFFMDPPVASHESTSTTGSGKGLELKKKEAPSVLGDGEPGSQSTDSQGSTSQNAVYDPERILQEQDAKEHDALRGYMEGKLVDPVRINISAQLSKPTLNVFISKLIAFSPSGMPLREPRDPNSVPNWLERWSATHFWKPLPQPRKVPDSKAANVESVSVQATSESEKPKLEMASSSSTHNVLEGATDNSVEMMKKEPTVTLSNQPDAEITPEPSAAKDVSKLLSSEQFAMEPLTEGTSRKVSCLPAYRMLATSVSSLAKAKELLLSGFKEHGVSIELDETKITHIANAAFQLITDFDVPQISRHKELYLIVLLVQGKIFSTMEISAERVKEVIKLYPNMPGQQEQLVFGDPWLKDIDLLDLNREVEGKELSEFLKHCTKRGFNPKKGDEVSIYNLMIHFLSYVPESTDFSGFSISSPNRFFHMRVFMIHVKEFLLNSCIMSGSFILNNVDTVEHVLAIIRQKRQRQRQQRQRQQGNNSKKLWHSLIPAKNKMNPVHSLKPVEQSGCRAMELDESSEGEHVDC